MLTGLTPLQSTNIRTPDRVLKNQSKMNMRII